MEIALNENERIDDLGRRGYRIIQNKEKFCFGVDAALLAWFSEVKPGDRVLDLGTGTGIVPILMDARNACGDYTALEIQEDMVEMAGRSVAMNQAEDHIRIEVGDIKTASTQFGKGKFNVITSNPPYKKAGTGIPNPDYAKAIARHEVLCTLEDVVREAAALLTSGGHFYMVHRPDRLPEIFRCFETYHIAPEKLISVHPYKDREATMILISGVAGRQAMFHVEEPIILYERENEYTEQVKRIYDDDYRNGVK